MLSIPETKWGPPGVSSFQCGVSQAQDCLKCQQFLFESCQSLAVRVPISHSGNAVCVRLSEFGLQQENDLATRMTSFAFQVLSLNIPQYTKVHRHYIKKTPE